MQTSRPTKGELVVFVLVGQAPDPSDRAREIDTLLLNSAGKQRNFGILAPVGLNGGRGQMHGWFRSLGVGTKRNNRPLPKRLLLALNGRPDRAE